MRQIFTEYVIPLQLWRHQPGRSRVQRHELESKARHYIREIIYLLYPHVAPAVKWECLSPGVSGEHLEEKMGMVVLCRVSLEERQVLAVNPAAIDGPSGQVLEV